MYCTIISAAEIDLFSLLLIRKSAYHNRLYNFYIRAPLAKSRFRTSRCILQELCAIGSYDSRPYRHNNLRITTSYTVPYLDKVAQNYVFGCCIVFFNKTTRPPRSSSEPITAGIETNTLEKYRPYHNRVTSWHSCGVPL